MTIPKFSITAIVRNEEKVIEKLLESIKEFSEQGGECVILDTGSSDNTVKIARSYGCKVIEVGEKYLHTIDKELADKINKTFIVDGEDPVVKEGDKYFDFASARNFCASLASNDIVSFADADECFERLDIDKINKFIEEGFTQFEYQFVFAKDVHGNEVVKFVQSKMYDRKNLKWVHPVHEVLQGEGNRQYLDESIFKLVHYQNHETGRHTYLKGLSFDAYNRPTDDRSAHYFGRELFWSGRPKSALKEFKRHIAMGGWAAERAESLLFMGDIYGQLGNPPEQVRMYNESFFVDSGRNKALINLALFYRHNKNFQAAICYAKAALEIPYNGFYADNLSFYKELPEEILYQAYGQCPHIEGYIEKAQHHLLQALKHQPLNPQYLHDTRYFFEYPDNGIEGWMQFCELQFLYNTAKKMESIIEVGSWCGRSSHSLLTGCKGSVTCVDSWKGSDDKRDYTNSLAKERDIFQVFQANVGKFENLKVIKNRSIVAAALVPDKSVDMVFLDAGHDFDSVVADIRAWRNKATKMLCGHDWLDPTWMGVISAVRQELGEPDEIHGTVWVKYIN